MSLKTISLVGAMVAFLALPVSGVSQMGAQRGGPGTPGDPVARLNRALQSAGAPVLDQNQHQELTSLVEAYRAARERDDRMQAIQSARDEMAQAILSGNEAEVNAAADKIAGDISTHAGQTIREMGMFKVQVLKLLTEQQVDALKQQYGTTGLVHLLGTPLGRGFKGGWFGHGHRGGR